MSKNIFKYLLLITTFFFTSPSLIFFFATFNSYKIFIWGLIALIFIFSICAKLIITPPKFLELVLFKWDKYILSIAFALVFCYLNLGSTAYISIFLLAQQPSQTETTLPIGVYFLSPILIFLSLFCFFYSYFYASSILYLIKQKFFTKSKITQYLVPIFLISSIYLAVLNKTAIFFCTSDYSIDNINKILNGNFLNVCQTLSICFYLFTLSLLLIIILWIDKKLSSKKGKTAKLK